MTIGTSIKLKKALEEYFLKRSVRITINPNKTLRVNDCGNLFSWEVLELAFVGEKLGYGMEIRPCLEVHGNLELFYSDHYLTLKYSK